MKDRERMSRWAKIIINCSLKSERYYYIVVNKKSSPTQGGVVYKYWVAADNRDRTSYQEQRNCQNSVISSFK